MRTAGCMTRMASALQMPEVPELDYDDLRSAILSKRDCNGFIANDDLFLDSNFPPDVSSLIFVYSGEDKYEKMLFRRPQDMCVSPTLYGIGGVCHVILPWNPCSDRHWFLYAVAVVTLNPRFMEKLMPGYKDFEQNFNQNYTGAFQFELWRFGEWIETIVDDYLPLLDGHLAYCQSLGNPPEFWAALIEKAYAKCHKAYEAIEVGSIVNVLTDLTGSVCEHFVLESTTVAFFTTLYKSSVNRSMIVCWRSAKSLKDRGFQTNRKSLVNGGASRYPQVSMTSDEDLSEELPNRLYVITTTTKFPLRDGMMLEMLRIKDPYCNGRPQWSGEFSQGTGWHRVSPSFVKNYRPQECRERSEFWMTYSDFRRYFGDVIICSSPEPYHGLDVESERKFKRDTTTAFTDLGNMQTTTTTTTPHGGGAGHRCRRSKSGNFNFSELSNECQDLVGKPKTWHSNRAADKIAKYRWNDGVRMERDAMLVCRDEANHHGSKDSQEMSTSSKYRRTFMTQKETHARCVTAELSDGSLTRATTNSQHLAGGIGISGTQAGANGQSPNGMAARNHRESGSTFTFSGILSHEADRQHRRMPSPDIDSQVSTSRCASMMSVSSGVSTLSDCNSTNSTSEIGLRLGNDLSRDSGRYRSECGGINSGDSAVLSDSSRNIFESRMDYFRCSGGWVELVRRFGKWKKNITGGPRSNMAFHSKNPRVSFFISRPDSSNEQAGETCQGKSHVIISLIQDYRPGMTTSNNLLRNIGFCVYKARHADKDEKRNLAKLSFVADVICREDDRQVTSRFDLDPGQYFLVPYMSEPSQEGDFFVRILTERERAIDKTSCSIS